MSTHSTEADIATLQAKVAHFEKQLDLLMKQDTSTKLTELKLQLTELTENVEEFKGKLESVQSKANQSEVAAAEAASSVSTLVSSTAESLELNRKLLESSTDSYDAYVNGLTIVVGIAGLIAVFLAFRHTKKEKADMVAAAKEELISSIQKDDKIFLKAVRNELQQSQVAEDLRKKIQPEILERVRAEFATTSGRANVDSQTDTQTERKATALFESLEDNGVKDAKPA